MSIYPCGELLANKYLEILMNVRQSSLYLSMNERQRDIMRRSLHLSEARANACVRYWVLDGKISVDPNLLAVLRFERKLVIQRKVLDTTNGLRVAQRDYLHRIVS